MNAKILENVYYLYDQAKVAYDMAKKYES